MIALGDLNTMGRKRAGNLSAISEREEIDALSRDAQQEGMILLPKTHDKTQFSHRYGEADLDHVLATNNLQFNDLGHTPGGQPAKVEVSGWPGMSNADRDDFIENLSDHCMLYFRVQ